MKLPILLALGSLLPPVLAQPAAPPPPPASAPAPQSPEPAKPLDDPFYVDEAALVRANLQRATRTAIAPMRVLARGMAGKRATAIVAMDATRRIFITQGDVINLETTVGPVTLRLESITRQSLGFVMADGTRISIP